MDQLIAKVAKSSSDLSRIQELSFLLKFDKLDKTRYAIMNRRGGQLYLKGMDYPTMEKASWNNRWNGWVPIINHPIDPTSISNKVRLIAETQADILMLHEIEDRESLSDLNRTFLPEYPGSNYADLALLPSPGVHGLHHGLLMKKGWHITKVELFSEEKLDNGDYLFQDGSGIIKIIGPGNMAITIISAQFVPVKDPKEVTDAIRIQQVHRIIEIYQELRSRGTSNIMLLGSLMAYSYCHSISPLFQSTDLKDVCRHPTFIEERDSINPDYHRLGGYAKGINMRQKSYFLVSPELYQLVTRAGINRKGIWAGMEQQWRTFRTLKSRWNQASDYPVLWVDLSIDKT
ncbi:hypothetical protein E0K83_12380 [Gramella sp. BOM4]|nr:hypothetical protein [Christiangramia bathymodioli]